MSKRTNTPRLPARALMLFAGISREYAAATDDEWDRLREHLDSQLDALAGGDARRKDALVAEFDRVRAMTVAARAARRLTAALRAGAATLQRTRGDGLEEWAVTADTGETAMLLVPTDEAVPAKSLHAARTALLTGTCPDCRRTAELVGGTLEVTHNSRCPARTAL